MVGLVVSGRTYNSENFEISLEPVVGKVIDCGTSVVRIWPNEFSKSVTISVDFLICALQVGNTFSNSEIVRIPYYLLTSILQANVDVSVTYLVNGPVTSFYTRTFSDFSTSLGTQYGGIIKKAKCPKIIWDDSVPYVGFSDFFVCYPATNIDPPGAFDQTKLIFIEQNFASYISPTFTSTSCGTTGSGSGSGSGSEVVTGSGESTTETTTEAP